MNAVVFFEDGYLIKQITECFSNLFFDSKRLLPELFGISGEIKNPVRCLPL
jgi:hypothetical protein